MFDSRKEKDFIESVVCSSLLEEAVEWIQYYLSPEEVFDKSDLEEWAENNGFVKEGD